jgi:integrase
MLGTISVRTVEALAPGQALWDRALPGFGVRRQQGAASYVFKYRAGGRQRFVTIGKHGRWTPDQARKRAKQLQGQIAEGKDPADEKAQAALRDADTLRSVIDLYLAHASQMQRPRTHSETRRYLLDLWQPLHSLSVFAIRRRHVATRVAEIAAASGAVSANRARANLSAMFNWAIREGYELPANPVSGSNRPAAPAPRDRVLTDAELRAIWLACGHDDYGSIVRLLILTGQRRNEVGGMQWSEITGDLWTIPGARTKNHREHTLPLSSTALALINAQPRRNASPFVFGKGLRGYNDWGKAKARLDARIAADGSPLAQFTIHDLRRTVATGMADRLGILPHIVEAVLNHASGHKAGVAGIYNRARYADEVRDALRRWSLEVSRIVRPRSLTLVRVERAALSE